MEEKITFLSDGLRLEGLFAEGDGRGGVVITHPHPQYGGDMYNPVVESIANTYQRMGWTTLRFNFRGKGQSQGAFDQGVGEQQDVHAAIAYLQGRNYGEIDLAGYSFGAWVNGLACSNPSPPDLHRMIMVSPPVAFIDFTAVGQLSALSLVITGSDDDIAPPKMIAPKRPHWNPAAHLEVIAGADHFYFGHLSKLERILDTHLKT